MNRHWLKSFALLLIAGMALPSFAQQPERMGRPEIPSPASNARRIVKEFKEVFLLTDKEYDKVYNQYLKYEKNTMPSQATEGNMPPQRPGMGAPGGRPGGGPGGFGGPGGGMNPPQMGGGMPSRGGANMGRGEMPEEMKAAMEEMQKEQEAKRKKAAKKLSKKMKKILDKEQYAQWQEWENERTSKSRQPLPPPMHR